MVAVCSRCALRESSQVKFTPKVSDSLRGSATRHRAVVIMSAVDLACPPERMQGSDEGPPWALESVDVSQQLDDEFVDAVACVVRLQIDLNVDRATLLRVLKCLSQGKVDNAKGLVPKTANQSVTPTAQRSTSNPWPAMPYPWSLVV